MQPKHFSRQDWQKSFYWGSSWKKTRKSFVSKRIRIDGGLCQDCEKVMGDVVHHVIPLNINNVNNPRIAHDHNNLRYVCHRCHNEYDAQGRKNPNTTAGVIFDDDGNPIKRV